MSYHIGIDLGGSSVKAVALSDRGCRLTERNVDFDAAESMQWADCVAGIIRDVESEQGRPAEALGLSAPGLAARDGRSIACMPGRLEGLVGLDWTDFLQRAQPVPVLNDGHAAVLGEAWLGAGKGCRDVFMLTLGTGVGGAAMVGGTLLVGSTGKAGHLGHISLNPGGAPDICGTPGSLEDAIGNCTVRERTNGRFTSTHELVSAYRAGDAEAGTVWLRSVRALAAAIAGLDNVLNPELVIVGGGIARSGDALFAPLVDQFEKMSWVPIGERARIVAAELGEFAGACGAVSRAIEGAIVSG